MNVTFTLPKGGTFDAFVGEKITDGRSGPLHEARRLSGPAALPEQMVVKCAVRGSEALLDLERGVYENTDHPSLARFLGWGYSAGGSVLAFERLGKNPLLALSSPGFRPRYRDPGTHFFPLPLGRALELGMDVALALEYLHSRGFVHGAIKPTTIFARVTGPAHETATVLRNVAEGAFEGVVGGLGAARSVAFLQKLAAGSVDAALAPSLDPVYSPPETLAAEEALPARGPAMDVYAFGLLLYSLLTGRLPYDHHRAKLDDVEAVLALKVRERQREVSPISIEALDDIPLHDVALEGDSADAWCALRTALAHLLRRTTDPDPALRCTASAAREYFEKELQLRPSLASGPRPWTARAVQMRKQVNRLTGEPPCGGVSLREENGAWVVEERRAPAPAPLPPTPELAGGASMVQFRAKDRAGTTALGQGKQGLFAKAPKGMTYLAEVLRERQAKRPLPVSCPVLVTKTTFGPKDLVQSMMYSLGRASARVRVEGDHATEIVRVVAGRGEECDIVLPDTSVSKKHLAIERRDGYWWVEDLGSTNGTVVDGFKVPRNGRLRVRGSFATIEVGHESRLTFMDEGELNVFLENAHEAWLQAFGNKKKPTGDPSATTKGARVALLPKQPAQPAAAPDEDSGGFLDQVPDDLAAPPPPAPARGDPNTQKFRRDLTRKIQATLGSTSGAGPAGAPMVPADVPPDLEDRLVWHDKAKATFRFIMRGSRVEEPESIEEALQIVRRESASLLSIEVLEPGGRKVVLFRKPSPDDSQEIPALPAGD